MRATFRTTLGFFMGQRSQFRRNLSEALPELLSLVRGDLPCFIYGSDIHRNEIPVFSFHSIDPVVFRISYNALDNSGLSFELSMSVNGKRNIVSLLAVTANHDELTELQLEKEIAGSSLVLAAAAKPGCLDERLGSTYRIGFNCPKKLY